ncbi:hypothetical protein DFH09DRAFT_1031699, partial [Mycena vulgaris]
MYEKLIVMLNDLAKDLEKISHAIKASVQKLEEYLNRSRRTKVYSLAMILNPTIKLRWLRDNWTSDDYIAAKDSLRASMLEYHKDLRSTRSAPITEPPTTASR